MNPQADSRMFSVIASMLDRAHYGMVQKVTAIVASIMPRGFDASAADEETIARTIGETLAKHSGSSPATCGIESRKDRVAFLAAIGAAVLKALSQAERTENQEECRGRE